MRNHYIRSVARRYYRALVPNFTGGFNGTADARTLPFSQGERAVGFDFSDGALTEGWGLSDSGMTDCARVWLFTRYDEKAERSERIVMYCDRSGAVFYRRDGDAAFAPLSGVRFTATPFAVNYRLYGEDVVILCSPRDGMAVWNGKEDAVIVGESPLITSLTLHYERMFVTIAGQKNAVWFSDDLDPTNWNPSLDEGGFIELTDERGRSNRVLSFLNYVYVLRDYGITRLTAQGKQTDFAAANLFVSGGRIYPETAAVCGDAVLFLCSDGFYSFDGVSTRRILKHLDGVLTAKGSPSAAYVGGKYFVSLRLRAEEDEAEGDEAANNALLTYDLRSGACSLLYGVDVRALCPAADAAGETLYAVCADGRVGTVEKNGKLFDEPTQKVWRSGLIDLGHPDRRKLVRDAFIDTAYDALLTVRTESGEKRALVRGGKGVQRVRINLTGSKIGLEIRCRQAKASVARPAIRYALVR